MSKECSTTTQYDVWNEFENSCVSCIFFWFPLMKVQMSWLRNLQEQMMRTWNGEWLMFPVDHCRQFFFFCLRVDLNKFMLLYSTCCFLKNLNQFFGCFHGKRQTNSTEGDNHVWSLYWQERRRGEFHVTQSIGWTINHEFLENTWNSRTDHKWRMVGGFLSRKQLKEIWTGSRKASRVRKN